MHTPHPDSHTHGLDPDCPECQSYAERPTGLDAENLKRIWRGEIHTPLDMQAYNALYRSAVTVQRLEEAFMYELGPDGTPQRVRGERGFLNRSDIDIWQHGGRT